MLVSEKSIFSPNILKIKVISMTGAELVLNANPDWTVDALKLQASSHFFDPSESVKTSLYHRVLHVSSGKILSETKTLTQEGIKDNDELLLLKRRIQTSPVDFNKKEDNKKHPSLESIKKATQSIPQVNKDRKTAEAFGHVDFQTELRKILISLIDAAQRLLCLNPEAAKLFQQAEELLNDPPPKETKVVVDQQALTMLMEIGFPRNRATRALIQCRMSAEDSIQWLLEHDSDPDIDDPVPGIKSSETEKESLTSPPGAESRDQGVQDSASATDSGDVTDGVVGLSRELAQISGPHKVKRMLQSFRAYRRKEFRPNTQALKSLVEMGFSESDAIDALRLHGNQRQEACEYLLGSHGQHKDQGDDIEEGLDPESSVYKAIMSNPTIQLGLNSPRSLIAFLYMLENPSSTRQWLNDSDTGPMLIQISRIYQAEKHSES